MGKSLIQQRRGKGSPAFISPSHRYMGSAKHKPLRLGNFRGRVTDLVHCPGHSGPLMEIMYFDGEKNLMLAPEGIKVGDIISIGEGTEVRLGNTATLSTIPEGTLIFNIESQPGDGGKFVRSAGTFAKVLAKTGDKVIVELPSKAQKEFTGECRATIGSVAGGGRKEKPFMKAGKKWHAMKARNKYYPIVSSCAMNAVDHPFGCKRSSRKGRPTIAPHNAPPGRMVGMIRPRHTGRNK